MKTEIRRILGRTKRHIFWYVQFGCREWQNKSERTLVVKQSKGVGLSRFEHGKIKKL
jgi:hypothetical protein